MRRRRLHTTETYISHRPPPTLVIVNNTINSDPNVVAAISAIRSAVHSRLRYTVMVCIRIHSFVDIISRHANSREVNQALRQLLISMSDTKQAEQYIRHWRSTKKLYSTKCNKKFWIDLLKHDENKDDDSKKNTASMSLLIFFHIEYDHIHRLCPTPQSKHLLWKQSYYSGCHLNTIVLEVGERLTNILHTTRVFNPTAQKTYDEQRNAQQQGGVKELQKVKYHDKAIQDFDTIDETEENNERQGSDDTIKDEDVHVIHGTSEAHSHEDESKQSKSKPDNIDEEMKNEDDDEMEVDIDIVTSPSSTSIQTEQGSFR
jgi:hypothetical protein